MCRCSTAGIGDVLWAEELAHELSPPIAFFDRWTARTSRGEPVDAEDIEIAREEIARLRTLVASLRKIRFPELETQARSLAELVTEATRLHESNERERSLLVQQVVPAALLVQVAASFASDVLAPLLKAVAASTAAGGQVELRAESSQPDVVLVLRGQPSAAAPMPDVQPWAARNALERQLAIACRVLRAHGGRVVRGEAGGAAWLRISLPASSFDGKELSA